MTQESKAIDTLITRLHDADGMVRQQARIDLVNIGQPAVDHLTQALADPNEQVQWEAAKALSQIGDVKSVQTLIALLEEPRPGIRWLAAEGLVAVGLPAVEPLLRALLMRTDSIWLREGAHHVLHDLVRAQPVDSPLRSLLMPVLAALSGPEPALTTPAIAWQALAQLPAEILRPVKK
jgi:HEAT repeat protein